MNRSGIINALIRRHGYARYLEIGTQNRANNFDKISCAEKTCVDPDPDAAADFVMTSDAFFAEVGSSFDIVFIDGLHHRDQVARDIENALGRLARGGSIVVHDCNPAEELHQRVPCESDIWNGDVWKAWVALRATRADLDMRVVDCNHGCGVIQRTSDHPRRLHPVQPLLASAVVEKALGKDGFAYFDVHRQELLNLVSVAAFTESLG